MKKYALITILLVLSLCLFSGAFVVAKADGETEDPVSAPTVYANDVQTTSGNSVYVYVYAKDFVNVSGIDLYLYFDKDVFTYNYHYVSDFLSSAVSDFNTNVVGQITTSSVTVNGLNGDGLLFYVCLDVKSGAKAGAYNFGVAVGDCYDTTLSPVTVNAIGAKITVSDPPVNLETIYFYTNVSSVSAKIGDTVTASFVTYDSRSFASADFEVEFDKSLLKVESVTLSQTLRNLNGAIYSINTATEGYVKTSFVALEGAPSYVYDAITVTFTVIADVTKNSEIKFTASGLSNSNFTPFLGSTAQMSLSLTEVPKTPVYPKVYVKTTTTSARDFTVDLVAESNTKIAAGDFLVGFDAQYFSCVKIESVTDGCMVVGNPAFQTGVARLSFIYEDGVSVETVIARLSFKTTASCGSVANFTLEGKNVTDKDYNPLTLDYLSGKITIEHAFSDTFTVDLEPKCLTDGSKSRHCSYCTASCDVTKIEALGHDPVHHDGQAADCENKGWCAYDTCSRCDYTSFKEIPALGHDEGTAVIENHIPATCLNGGTYNSVVYCTVCGDKLSSMPKTEDALGHKEGTAVKENYIPATCLNGGTYNSVVYCTVCGDKLSSTPKTEEALGHDPVHHDGQAADCENNGWEAYDTCSRCDYTTYSEIPALGHDEQDHSAQAPTCTAIGWNAYVTCSRCDYTTYSELKALGHNSDGSIAHEDAKCTETGVVGGKYCTRCNDGKTTAEAVIPALGHDEQDHSAQAPTCTAIGWNAYVTCSRCDYTTYSELKALGHNSDGSIAHEDAKCTETGVVGGKYCTRCNDGKTTAETVIPALGHDEQDYSAQAPTCTAIGWNAYVTCSRCDYTTYSELKALGHNSDGSIAHKDAKCTETGVVGGKYCTRCNDGKTAAEVVIPALGHDEQDHSAQAPTCTAIGWNAYVTCSRCDYTTYSEISALEHDPIHHDGQAADCENNGWEAYDTCSRCDYTTYFEIPALGHDYVSVDVTEPTCTTDGLISKKQCVNCGQEVDVEEVIPSHGHDWSDWAVVKEASSTEKGLKERVCSRCEFKETVDIPVVKKEDSSGGGCAGCGSSNMAELFSTALLSLAALFFKRH